MIFMGQAVQELVRLLDLYNLTQLISRFAYLYLKESKCSKWQDGNFTNNLTLLLLFVLYHDCWNLCMCRMYVCAFENNVITTDFCIMFTTCHLQDIKQTLPYIKISNLLSSNLSPHFSYSSQLANCSNPPTP